MSRERFLLQDGARVVCMGDSITEDEAGYVSVMRNLIAAAYPERRIQLINSGVSGNRAPDMLARVDADVIAHTADWVTLSVGINDVWHGFERWDDDRNCPVGTSPNGVSVAEYTACVKQIAARVKDNTQARLVFITPTVIGENLDNPDNIANRRLDDYVSALESIAPEQDGIQAPMRQAFAGAIRAGAARDPGFRLTTDGVHMNAVGAHVMALTVLNALGWSAAPR